MPWAQGLGEHRLTMSWQSPSLARQVWVAKHLFGGQFSIMHVEPDHPSSHVQTAAPALLAQVPWVPLQGFGKQGFAGSMQVPSRGRHV